MKTFKNAFQDFLDLENKGSVLLIFAILVSMVVANSPLYESYKQLAHIPFVFSFAGIDINKDLHFVVNDGLIVIFFLLAALELKRELTIGELKEPKDLILPVVSALCGVLLPVGIYMALNNGTPTEGGWAIPAATDIAIALGILQLFGNRVPVSLKIFLLSLAIIDDMLIIGVISVFFTKSLDYYYLMLSVLSTAILILMNRKNVTNFAPFAVVGFFLWYFTFKSGIHATIAGVVLGFTIPMSKRHVCDDDGNIIEEKESMLESLEHSLHETVSLFILPLFAFINAGVKITGEGVMSLAEPVSLGIIGGLVLGKIVGVFTSTYLLIKFKIVNMPTDATWSQLLAVSALCGVGFTMGLFIGDLSFAGTDVQYKLPILIASTASALIGVVILKMSLSKDVNEAKAVNAA